MPAAKREERVVGAPPPSRTAKTLLLVLVTANAGPVALIEEMLPFSLPAHRRGQDAIPHDTVSHDTVPHDTVPHDADIP